MSDEHGGDKKTHYEPIYVISAVFGSIFVFVPLLIRKNEHKGIIRCCIMLTAFCMWIFWVTVYIAQMDPLVGPRLSKETLAWVSHKWTLDWKGKGINGDYISHLRFADDIALMAESLEKLNQMLDGLASAS